jgi:hypothetical protein
MRTLLRGDTQARKENIHWWEEKFEWERKEYAIGYSIIIESEAHSSYSINLGNEMDIVALNLIVQTTKNIMSSIIFIRSIKQNDFKLYIFLLLIFFLEMLIIF